MKPYLVGITGGSASGKTFILDALCKPFAEDELTLISLDNYYKELDEQVRDESGRVNFDHPESLNLDLFARHLQDLLEGKPVVIREYTFNNPARIPALITYKPAPIIIVEGLFVMNRPQVQRLLDLKVYIETDEHVKLARRIRRDLVERGYPLEEILEDYEQYVVPMYRKFVAPYKHDCDLILPNNRSRTAGLTALVNHLKTVLAEARAE